MAAIQSETLYGIIILFALATVAGAVLIKQSRFDPGVFFGAIQQKGSPASLKKSSPDSSLSLSNLEPPGYEPMNNLETFDEQTLSEKINGKAELYLDAGFQRLFARRFVKKDDPAQWFELFVYDMSKPPNAFSVFSLQRRADGVDASLAEYAYRAENALFFMQGKHYVEMIAAQRSEEAIQSMENAAQNLVNSLPTDELKIPELELLPEENLVEAGIKYFTRNAFGYEKFDHVLTARYRVSGKELTIFILVRESPAVAETLAREYHKFLLNLGGEKIETSGEEIPGLLGVDIVGDYELIFHRGRVLAGIHAATAMEPALELARILFGHLVKGEQ